MPARNPSDLLPLKPLVFHILVVLLDGDHHGWALLRALEARIGAPVLPGQLYRQVEAMLAEDLISEQASGSGAAARQRDEGVGGAAPKRFFRLTPFGRKVVVAEAGRLESLVEELRTKRLLPQKGRS